MSILQLARDALTRGRRRATERFWSAAFEGGGITTWLHEPVVRRYVNASVTGEADVWPMEWLAASLPAPIERARSLACGDGALERDLRRKNICRTVVGIDISADALRLAAARAEAEGIDGITYERGDLNSLSFSPASVDAAFFHQALHHVERLDACLDAVAAGLAPGGLLYLDEYVGPSRSQWRHELLDEAESVYQALPRAVRRRQRLGLPVDRRDPSEAVRSSDILEAVDRRFRVETRRDYGGNFLAVIHPHLDFSRVTEEEKTAVLNRIIDAERDALEDGAASYYTVILARPRSDAAAGEGWRRVPLEG